MGLFTELCKRNVPYLKIPALSAGSQSDLPMHSPISQFRKVLAHSLNLAPFLLLDPVLLRYVRFDPPLCLSLPSPTSTSTLTAPFVIKLDFNSFMLYNLIHHNEKAGEKGNI